MRFRKTQNGITLNIVAGTSAILFSIDMEEQATDGLLGFYIRKKNEQTSVVYDFKSIKYFKSIIQNPAKGAQYSTKEHPWQSFLWEDFYVELGAKYSYTFSAAYGAPGDLKFNRAVDITISVPSTSTGGIHEVFFNRGVAGSQAYAREFKNKKPSELEGDEKKRALKWLSKGLKEALIGFIDAAQNDSFAIRCCFYEFENHEVHEAIKKAVARGVDVKIIYDSRKQKTKNDKAIKESGLPRANLIRRSKDPDLLQHNKFMVLLEGENPKAVWTGSTNITEKGIYGQCNTGHIIRDVTVAGIYLSYWTALKSNPANAKSKLACIKIQDDVTAFAPGMSVFFSPRTKTKLLGCYADLLTNSQQLVCGMFPFSFNKQIKEATVANTNFLKYIIIDKKDKNTTLKSNDVDNVIVYGGELDEPLYDWLNEINAGKLFRTGTNYIHNKVILIDPMSDNPVVVSGSANFSDNSILKNDENTLVVVGDTKLADLYFTEFLRVFNHYSTRSDTKKLVKKNKENKYNPSHLQTKSKDWTASFFKPNKLKFKRRMMFSAMTPDLIMP